MRLKIKESITLKVTYANGDSDITRFNGTFEDAQNYYLNKTFNIGSVNDNMQKCVAVDEVSDDITLESTQIKNDNLNESPETRDIFCVDCDTITTHTYKGPFKDGKNTVGRYICNRCGCENDGEALTEARDGTRQYTDKALDLIDSEILSARDVVMMAFKWMSEEDVAQMFKANDVDLDGEYFDEEDVDESLTEKSNIKVTAKVKASDEDIKYYDNYVNEIFEDALNMQKEISLGKISGLDRYEKLAYDIVNLIEDTRIEWHTNESLDEDTDIALSEKLGDAIENIKAIKDALNQTVTGKNDNGLGSTGAFASWISTGFDLDMENIAEVAVAMDFDVYKTDIGYFGDKDYLIMFPGQEITTYPDFDSSFIEDSFEKIN